ncbi:aspartate:alanine exchanger family transporter [Luteimonas salinilitoris]|uniref:Aspartate:alanine exchanger family transporter n=1 Tax=Luteimonas salinilitoris TaxID=3237697 RepID=A0ABV4HW47_9GAMM
MKQRQFHRSVRGGAWLAILMAALCIVAVVAMPAGAQASGGAGAGVEQLATSAEPAAGNVLELFKPVMETGLHGFFELLGSQPIVFLLLALAIGYPLGAASVAGISLGSTAGTLVSGVILSIIAKLAFDISYDIPTIVSSIFLLLFMYALGLRVGPQFFSGLRSGGKAFIVIGVIVWALNWIICVGGAKLVGMEPGYAAGMISGSYTITAVMGVAQGAVQSGAVQLPEGLSAAQVGANIATGYAISYILSSIGIILVIRYLPKLFGRDPVADAKVAEQEFSHGATHPVPGAPDSLVLGFSPYDLRAYRVEHEELIGKTVLDMFKQHPYAPILRVVRDGKILDQADDTEIRKGDIVTLRTKVHELILEEGEKIGPEVDDELARNIPLETADIRVGSHEIAGKTLDELGRTIGFGVQLTAMFRGGQEIPIGPNTDVRFGDVARLTGPDVSIQRIAKALGGRPILDSTVTEVTYMAIAMLAGYLVGILSITVAGIPLALGTSAGCMLAGIFVSYFRSRNPEFGGPVSEGARSFLQDIGLNMFVAVLAANVGPKVIDSFQGTTVAWVALIGTTAALLPVVVAYFVGLKMFGLNSVICDGACAGARNATPGLNAIADQSKSSVAAVPFPVTYALTTVLALIGGYVAMILS